MSRLTLSQNMIEKDLQEQERLANAGPFITISRQFGCQGFSLGLLLLDILNEECFETPWQIYHREILERLAQETNMDVSLLERERTSKPKLLVEFFRAFKKERVPSGYEIRNRIASMIHDLAEKGNAIIIGQGSSGITTNVPNGLSVRLEAPEDFRVKQIAFREGLTETQARLRIRAIEKERQYLRKIYETRYHRNPPFHLVFDSSEFTLAQIAQQIVYSMKMKGLIPKR